jgi:hypothetical protein
VSKRIQPTSNTSNAFACVSRYKRIHFLSRIIKKTIWNSNIFDGFIWNVEHLSVNWSVLYDNLVNNISWILCHLFACIFHKIVNHVFMQYNSVKNNLHNNDLDNIFFVKKRIFSVYQLSPSMLDKFLLFRNCNYLYTK